MLDNVWEYIFMLKIWRMKHPLHFCPFAIVNILLMKLTGNENAQQILHICTSVLGSQKEYAEILHCRDFMPGRKSHFLFYR